MGGVSPVSGARVSKNGNLVVENRDGSQDVITKDGRTIHQNAPGMSKDTYRPTPPSSSRPTPPSSSRPTPPSSSRPTPPSTSRPTPPSTGGYDRPTPPSSGYGYDRPTPPPVHEPRYYWQPSFPVYIPSNPRPVPRIELPPSPAPARQVGLNEVTTDIVDLLTEKQRLRDEKKRLLMTTHPELTSAEAKAKLASGQTVWLAADGGAHLSKDAYKPIKNVSELAPLLPGVREQKRGELQAGENRAYQNRVAQWSETDIQHRVSQMPAFNSIYNTDRLAMQNMMVTEGGRSFNRNMITAMNVYNQPSVQREIARKWQDNPEMSTPEFNRMANHVIADHVQNLFWQSNYMGDWGTYLGTNPVPGLRYPDTQEDVDYNAAVIRRVASELPMLLNNSVND